MCISPIYIANPNYRYNERHFLKDPTLFLKDSTSQFLAVPCHVCSQCIALKQLYMVQRVQMESLFNHIFFATLTYNNECIPRVSCSSGYDIPFADMRDLKLAFKRINNDNAFGVPFRYFAVSEFGSLKGRPHLHCLIFIRKECASDYPSILNLEARLSQTLFDYWQRNYGSDRKPFYKPLCTYHEKIMHNKLYRNYDLHYVNPTLSKNGCSDSAFYVLKYMLKQSNKEIRLQQALHLNLPQEEYESIWSLIRPQNIHSLGFGYNGQVGNNHKLYFGEISLLIIT